ncbi:PPC domain-containing DNA-binding protein [Candidatus Margulisiibacteriota bacterium]
MKVQEGKLGRVFILAFDHEEEILEPLKNFIKEKKIKAGFIYLLGAVQSGQIVCGPKETVVPPDPIKKELKEANELVAIGSIFWEGAEPKVHLHAALGKGEKTLLGCIRKAAKVFITIEALLLEVTDVNFEKKLDPKIGLPIL